MEMVCSAYACVAEDAQQSNLCSRYPERDAHAAERMIAILGTQQIVKEGIPDQLYDTVKSDRGFSRLQDEVVSA